MMVKRLEYHHHHHHRCFGFSFSFGGTDWAQKARRRERELKLKLKRKRERNYAENRKQSDWLAESAAAVVVVVVMGMMAAVAPVTHFRRFTVWVTVAGWPGLTAAAAVRLASPKIRRRQQQQQPSSLSFSGTLLSRVAAVHLTQQQQSSLRRLFSRPPLSLPVPGHFSADAADAVAAKEC